MHGQCYHIIRMQLQRPESTQSDFQKDTILGHNNNKNIQNILRKFRLKFLRIMYSTSCYKERLNFENTLYINDKDTTNIVSLQMDVGFNT
jgi:hypothetical protein